MMSMERRIKRENQSLWPKSEPSRTLGELFEAR